MAKQAPGLPALPKKRAQEKVPKQFEVDVDLWKACEIERDRLGYKNNDVMEYGLKAFLLKANPQRAAQLGITAEDD